MLYLNKLKFSIIALFLLTSVGFSDIHAQGLKTPAPSPTQKITQDFALSEIQIDYSRPSIKGRTVFGDLVPFGKVWRTGANQSTKITFGEDVKINGLDVKAGTYAIYTIPGEKEWKLMLYSDLNLGGNVAGYDEENEIIAFTLPVRHIENTVESFTIQVDDLRSTSCQISFTWENTSVSLSVTADIDAKVMGNIEQAMQDTRPYGQAANYYLQNGKDLNQAYEWIQKAVDQNPNAYWLLLSKAKIEKSLGKYDAAIISANQSKEKASAAQNNDYIKMCTQLVEEINQIQTKSKQKIKK